MKLNELFDDKKIDPQGWVVWTGNTFDVQLKRPSARRSNRETLARVYVGMAGEAEKQGAIPEQASRSIRALWIEESDACRPKSLPRIIGEDGFLRMYALGLPLSVEMFHRLWKHLGEPLENTTIELEPLYVEWNPPDQTFYDIDATPPGILSKLFRSCRVKKDEELIALLALDLQVVSHLDDPARREMLTMALLSHGAAYRELEGRILQIPSFTEKGRLVPYLCRQHLIAEGVKTVSLVPQEAGAVPLYLCQGTELWPSQPSMLGSILANFAEHGSATEAYAHSWRLIHKQLRALPGHPIVAGHSMGGSLALQIALYSHNLTRAVYAFNPPVPNERDYLFYHQLSPASREKIHVVANLDDFAFWRIGAKLIGDITLFLGKKRWRYYGVYFWDCLFFFPAFIKFILNVRHAFPSHQHIVALSENWVSFKLTPEEIEKENTERTTRFDYLHFFTKLYDPTKTLLTYIRKVFKWRLEKDYLRNEIEIISLHERELLDTLSEANATEIAHELQILRAQKAALLSRLLGKD